MLGAEGRGGSGMYPIKTTLASVTNLTGKKYHQLAISGSCQQGLDFFAGLLPTSTGKTDRPMFKGS